MTDTEQTPTLEVVLKDSGLELTESEQIRQSYLPYFIEMSEVKEMAKKIDFDNPKDIDETIARELRLRTVKIRTGSENLKDSRKRLHMLKANVEQDAWNLIKSTCKLDEERFLQVEKNREIQEKLRIDSLRTERL